MCVCRCMCIYVGYMIKGYQNLHIMYGFWFTEAESVQRLSQSTAGSMNHVNLRCLGGLWPALGKTWTRSHVLSLSNTAEPVIVHRSGFSVVKLNRFHRFSCRAEGGVLILTSRRRRVLIGHMSAPVSMVSPHLRYSTGRSCTKS